MNQDDLSFKSISEMTDDELYELLKKGRSNRRKQPKKAHKKTAKKPQKKPAEKVLQNLTKNEKQKLLNDLGGLNNDNN